MPVVVDIPGVGEVEFPDSMSEAQINAEAARLYREGKTGASDKNTGGVTSALVMGARKGPAVAKAASRASGRFIAEHPATVQRAVGATVRGVTGGLGAASGGVTGAIVGSAAGAGLTPKQESIRYLGGRMAGESAEVARDASRATGVQNYIKSTSGLKVKPSDILMRSRGLPAAESYAKEMGRDILKIYGPDGRVVAGPTAAVTDAARRAPGVASRVASAAKVLPILEMILRPSVITDLAQTIEPTRRDIGVMGIGQAPDAEPEFNAGENAGNIQRMEDRLRHSDAARAEMLERLMGLLGLR